MMQPDQQASIAAQLAALPNTPMKALWVLWDEHFPRRPTHTNRSYIESRIAYRIQELAYGELPAGIRRHLADCGAKHSKIAIAKKGLCLPNNRHEILQVLSLNSSLYPEKRCKRSTNHRALRSPVPWLNHGHADSTATAPPLLRPF